MVDSPKKWYRQQRKRKAADIKAARREQEYEERVKTLQNEQEEREAREKRLGENADVILQGIADFINGKAEIVAIPKQVSHGQRYVFRRVGQD